MIHIVKLGAEWCAPCRKYDPILDTVAAERDDITVTKIDIDQDPEVAKKYGVQGIPLTVFLNEVGEQIDQYQGPIGRIHLNKVIDQLQSWPDV